MLQVTGDCAIDVAELVWRFTPSGGPGGQHANRSATRAEVTFDVAGSPYPVGGTKRLAWVGSPACCTDCRPVRLSPPAVGGGA